MPNFWQTFLGRSKHIFISSMTVELASTEAADKNNSSGDGQPKTAKQLEKEAKKLAKLEKLKQKQEKLASIASKDKSQVNYIYSSILTFAVQLH